MDNSRSSVEASAESIGGLFNNKDTLWCFNIMVKSLVLPSAYVFLFMAMESYIETRKDDGLLEAFEPCIEFLPVLFNMGVTVFAITLLIGIFRMALGMAEVYLNLNTSDAIWLTICLITAYPLARCAEWLLLCVSNYTESVGTWLLYAVALTMIQIAVYLAIIGGLGALVIVAYAVIDSVGTGKKQVIKSKIQKIRRVMYDK